MVAKNSQKNLETPKIMAVIDIGSTAVRLNIAQTRKDGTLEFLESLQQAVNLGKDTFTSGSIRRNSMEECVGALISFRRILDEYRIKDENQLRIVATTAVREASNRDTFLNRIYIAAGFDVEVIEDVDLSRLTYLSLNSYLSNHGNSWSNKLLVTEMSGGSTEVLLFEGEDVLLSRSYRIGALRLREMLGEFRSSTDSRRELMENDINRTVGQIVHEIGNNRQLSFIALGGDIRFAASRLLPTWNNTDPVELTLSQLSKFTEDIIKLSTDELVHNYHLTFSDAETLGPALLYYINLGRALNAKKIIVTDISMRHGILMEMAMRGSWKQEFIEQIINSAIETGKKFCFDEAHAKHVADLSTALFKNLRDEHHLEPWHEVLLMISALLHDIGSFISIRSHHKHSMYLIQNSELFGLNRKDIQLISLTARYHRRSSPKPEHLEYTVLDRKDKIAVVKMAALLRIADALDRSNSGRIKTIRCVQEDDNLIINIPGVDDLSLEQLGIRNKGSLFEDVFGMKVVLRKQNHLMEN